MAEQDPKIPVVAKDMPGFKKVRSYTRVQYCMF